MHVSQMTVRNALAAVVMSALVVGATSRALAADRFAGPGKDARPPSRGADVCPLPVR